MTTTTQNELMHAEAAKFNLFTAENLPEVYKSPQYLNGSTFEYIGRVERDLQNNILPSDVLKEFIHGLFFECKQQKRNFSEEIELYYIDHSYRLFLTPAGNLAMLKHHKGKYTFFPYYSYHHKWYNIEYNKRVKALEVAGVVEPQQIGVFTPKKVQSWLNYCDSYINCLYSFAAEAQTENEKIQQKINDFIEKSGGKASTWGNDPKITTVDCKLFQVRFNHYERSQYMSHEVTFKGGFLDVLDIIEFI